MSNSKLTFRSSRIIYHGPHPCENCGVLIAKMAHAFGGNAFTYPNGPIYPNTEWHPHVCDPSDVLSLQSKRAKAFILETAPNPRAVRTKDGWVILSNFNDRLRHGAAPGHTRGMGLRIISAHQTYGATPADAWRSAEKRRNNDWPAWDFPDDGQILEVETEPTDHKEPTDADPQLRAFRRALILCLDAMGMQDWPKDSSRGLWNQAKSAAQECLNPRA